MSKASHLIAQANKAYYASTEPLLTDTEFDLLQENGLELPLETTQKVRHRQITRSLSKQKSEEDVWNWLKGFRGTVYICPKFDGNSIRLTYEHGKLVRAATRGDGYYGHDVTPAILQTKCCQHLQKPISAEISVEAILAKNADVGETTSNFRNIVAGAIHAKTGRELILKQVSCIAYQIETLPGQNWEAAKQKLEQLVELEITPSRKIQLENITSAEFFNRLKSLYREWSSTLCYAIDGIVLYACFPDGHKRNDNSLLIPKNATAIKFSETIYPAEIDCLIWTQGLHQRLTPKVLLTKPIRIDGANVQRASASNFALAAAAGLGPGAKIGIVKSGDIIPEIKEVYVPAATPLELPNCPDCAQRSQLDKNGVQALCVNPNCPGRTAVKLKKQIQRLQIPNFSDATVQSCIDAGLVSLSQILNCTAEEFQQINGIGRKKAIEFAQACQTQQITAANFIAVCCIQGFAEKRAEMILEQFGSLEHFLAALRSPEHLRQKLSNFPALYRRLEAAADEILQLAELFQGRITHIKQPSQTIALKICVTDAHPELSRSQFKQQLLHAQIELLNAVTPSCQYLVCQNLNPEKPSSKFRRAQKLQIPILTYAQFTAKFLTDIT